MHGGLGHVEHFQAHRISVSLEITARPDPALGINAALHLVLLCCLGLARGRLLPVRACVCASAGGHSRRQRGHPVCSALSLAGNLFCCWKCWRQKCQLRGFSHLWDGFSAVSWTQLILHPQAHLLSRPCMVEGFAAPHSQQEAT